MCFSLSLFNFTYKFIRTIFYVSFCFYHSLTVSTYSHRKSLHQKQQQRKSRTFILLPLHTSTDCVHLHTFSIFFIWTHTHTYTHVQWRFNMCAQHTSHPYVSSIHVFMYLTVVLFSSVRWNEKLCHILLYAYTYDTVIRWNAICEYVSYLVLFACAT